MKTKSTLDFKQLCAALRTAQENPSQEIPQIRHVMSQRATVINSSKRILRLVASDETWDRCGSVIRANGWMLEDYMKNPVFLWCHDTESPAIGQAVNAAVVSKTLVLDIQFATQEEYAFADTIYRLYLGGFLRANSVGMNPIEWNWVNDGEGNEIGVEFVRQELWEDSACPVPANPNALVMAVRTGDINRGEAADYTARLVYDGHFDSADAREALSESVRSLMKHPDFESQIILALRNLGATHTDRTPAAQPATVKFDWAKPLEELRALNQTIKQ